MSSSSSAEPIHRWIARALSALHEEHPVGYARLIAFAQGVSAAIEVDGEPCGVTFRGGSVVVEPVLPDPSTIDVATDRMTIAAVMSGEMDFDTALRSDRLRARGELAELVRAHEVLSSFVGTSIHARSQHHHYGRFVDRYRDGGKGTAP